MNGFNKVILAGNLTRDVELRYTTGGTPVAKGGLAVNRKWKDSQTQEQKEEVTFVDFTAWSGTAEVMGQYCKKGKPILIEGRLQLEQWDDRQTQQKRSRLTVVVESMTFLPDGGGQGGGSDYDQEPRQRPAQNQSRYPSARPGQGRTSAPPPDDGQPTEEDDVPF